MSFKCHNSNSFKEVSSKIKYGVEIEINSKYERNTENYYLDMERIQNKLPKDWEIKREHCGYEIVSPILQGDYGLRKIYKICLLVRDYKTNNECGLHLHLDMRDFNEEQKRRIGFAYSSTYDGWASFVNKYRKTSKYCKKDPGQNNKFYYLGKDFYDDDDYDDGDRRIWTNWEALYEHGSLEIRLHHGTKNYEEIKNWIILHTNFIQKVASSDELSLIKKFYKNSNKADCIGKILSVTRNKEVKEFYLKKSGVK